MRRLAVILIFAAALGGRGPGTAWGDVFLLKSGGRVEGTLQNPDEKPRQTWVVQLDSGGEVTLDAAKVAEVQSARSDLKEYQRVRPTYPDTVEGQLALAEWCKEHKLGEQRKTHLLRVVELDPNHVEAHRALGQSKYGSKWMTRDEYMLSQGYRPYKGSYKLPQEIEQEEAKRKRTLAEQEWCQKIARWRGWMAGNKAAQGRENIVAIVDPLAVKGLTQSLNLKNEKSPPARLACAEALAGIGTDEALLALANCSMYDPVEEVRLTCLDHLEKKKAGPKVTKFYLDKHRLGSKDNATINRAALALGRLKDPSTINPLIDVLVTKHTFSTGGNPGGMSMSFPTGGGGGSGLGMNQKPKVTLVFAKNQKVLDALVAITGQNFDFDVQSWRNWYNAQKKVEVLDARRN